MRVQKKGLGWRFYAAVFFFFALIFVAIDPTMDRNPLSRIKNSVHEELIVALGLSGMGQEKLPQLLGTVVEKSLQGKLPSPPDDLEIHLKFKHLKKLKDEREKAIALTILADADFYPAVITYKGEDYDARLRLKGDLMDHWKTTSRWSFRVRLKGGRTILGFNQFSLHKPESRQLPYDHMFQAWMRAAGILAPRHTYARVRFNGDDWGVMNVEEHTTKALLEVNQRKEAPIIKVGSQQSWVIERINKAVPFRGWYHGAYDFSLNNDKKYANDPTQLAWYSYGVHLFRRFRLEEFSPDQVFDLDQFSRAFIAGMIWQNFHGLDLQNLKLAFNPYTLRLEPITQDQGELISYKKGGGVFDIAPPQDIEQIMRSPVFQSHFEKNLKILKEAAPVLRDEYIRLCAIFPYDCPPFSFDTFEDNLQKIEHDGLAVFRSWLDKAPPRSAPSPTGAQPVPEGIRFTSHVFGEYYDNGRLVLWNETKHDLTLEQVRLNCRKNAVCEDQVLIEGPQAILGGHDGRFTRQTVFQIPKGIWLNNARFLEIDTRLGEETHTQKIKLTLPTDLHNPFLDVVSVIDDPDRPAFISVKGQSVVVQPGEWQVERPIRIPAGYRLEIAAGTVLWCAPDVYILSQSPVEVLGMEHAPVRLRATNPEKGWQGIYVSQAGSLSTFRHVEIAGTRAFEQGILTLTGGVTFYQSDVQMDHVTFNGSEAEDALNTVRSTFDIQNAVFRNTRSDAFDSDFSKGRIVASQFNDIDGDGLDTSGSVIEGADLSFANIVDKAISVGEASRVKVEGVIAHNVGSAVVSKDGSQLTVSRLEAHDVKLYAAMAYVKKEMYGPAELILTNTAHQAHDVYNQSGNRVFLDGQDIPGRDLDVDELYAQGPMKKVK